MSVQLRVDVGDPADRAPHRLGRLALGERLHHRAAAELGDHEVAGPGLGVRLTEMAVHPIPEIRQAHPLSMRADGGWTPAEAAGARARKHPDGLVRGPADGLAWRVSAEGRRGTNRVLMSRGSRWTLTAWVSFLFSSSRSWPRSACLARRRYDAGHAGAGY